MHLKQQRNIVYVTSCVWSQNLNIPCFNVRQVAGGLSSGLGFRECAEKECQEEASVPEKYLKNLKSTGTVR